MAAIKKKATAKKKTAAKKKPAKKKTNKPSRNKNHHLLDNDKFGEGSIKRERGQNMTDRDKMEINRRASINRIIRQEDMRERIRQGAYIRNIQNICTELGGIIDRTKQEKTIGPAENRKLSLRLKALKQSADNQFRMLNKLLPDERLVELRDPTGNDPFSSLAAVMKTALDEDGSEYGESADKDDE